MLSGQKGVQGKSLFINERLPKSDMEIKRKCDNMNLVTTTHNCQVKVFCQRPNGSFFPQSSNSLAGVEQLDKIAAKNRSVKTGQDLTTILKQFIKSSLLGAILVLN